MSDATTAAAYVRVSTREQKEDKSHIRQRKRMAEWGESEDLSSAGWEQYHTGSMDNILDWDPIDNELTGDIHWYEDIAISGQSDERDGYDRLLDNYEQYDYIVVRELSRFGRDAAKVLQDLRKIGETEGVEFVSVTEPMLDTTSAHGKLMINLIASLNDFYAELRSEQAQRMVERRKEQGLPVGRPTKLDDTQIEEAREWNEKGLSYSAVATLMEDKYGVEVSRQTIYRYCRDAAEVES
jgi:DNA invertase Pin-like site-specific DNA recombinase